MGRVQGPGAGAVRDQWVAVFDGVLVLLAEIEWEADVERTVGKSSSGGGKGGGGGEI